MDLMPRRDLMPFLWLSSSPLRHDWPSTQRQLIIPFHSPSRAELHARLEVELDAEGRWRLGLCRGLPPAHHRRGGRDAFSRGGLAIEGVLVAGADNVPVHHVPPG